MQYLNQADGALTSRAFQDQMTLRRGMLDVATVSLRATRQAPRAQALLLEGIIACRGCRQAGPCADWLSSARKPASPPDFCPMRGTVLKLRDLLATASPV
jgi:hypothetical protein